MSQIHGLSDQKVTEELRKMTGFIRQEALEKSREITLKANEEFAIEKARIVRQEIDEIDKLYEKKYKQAQMAQQIGRSTLQTKARLQVLTAQQEVIDSIFATAEKRLSEGAQDKVKYEKTLSDLILEGFLRLAERNLQVRARAEDNEIVTRAIETAAKEYKEKEGKEISATIAESDPLPEGSAGGVIILGSNGKVSYDNTFEGRLDVLKESALPSIRKTIFGENENRKHFE